MGLGKLNVWCTETDNPCKINERTIYVSVFTCGGSILEWNGRQYYLLEGLHGHLEVEVPPGIYYVRASSLHCTNGYTDAAVVRITCEETVCVTLMVPSIRRCIAMLNFALAQPMAREMIDPELIQPARNALTKIETDLGRPTRVFELHEQHLTETAKRFKSANIGAKKKAD
jgi:hypothetical protein